MLISNGRFLFVSALLSYTVIEHRAQASAKSTISLDTEITETIRQDTLDKIGLHTEEYQKSLDIIEKTIESYLNKKKLDKNQKQKLTYAADNYDEYKIKAFSPANWNWVVLQEYVKYAVLHYISDIDNTLRIVEDTLLKQEKMKEYTSAIQRARQDISVYMGSGYGALINAYRRIDLTEKSAKAIEKSNNNFIQQTLEYVKEIKEESVHKSAKKILDMLTDKNTDDKLKKNFCFELSFDSLVSGSYSITQLAGNELVFERKINSVWKEFHQDTTNMQDSNLFQNKDKFYQRYVEIEKALPIKSKEYFDTNVYPYIIGLCNDFYELFTVKQCVDSAAFMEKITERSEKIRSDFLIRSKNFYIVMVFDLFWKSKNAESAWLDNNKNFHEYYLKKRKDFISSPDGQKLTEFDNGDMIQWAQKYTDAMKIDEPVFALKKWFNAMEIMKKGADNLVQVYNTSANKKEIETKLRKELKQIIKSM